MQMNGTNDNLVHSALMEETMANTREITLGINIPAYCTVEVPSHVGDGEDELKDFARALFEDWWNDGHQLLFTPEYGEADPDSERILSVSETGAEGEAVRVLAEHIALHPPEVRAEFCNAERACRRGLQVHGYLLASTAHMTPEEAHTFACGSSLVRALIVSATSQDGCFLELDEAIFAEDADPAVLLEMASDGLRGVVELAVAHGLRMVRFDALGPIIEGVPSSGPAPGAASMPMGAS